MGGEVSWNLCPEAMAEEGLNFMPSATSEGNLSLRPGEGCSRFRARPGAMSEGGPNHSPEAMA